MSTDTSRTARRSGTTLELLHKWYPGDGKAAMQALAQRFNESHAGVQVDERTCDNLGLEIKSRILQEDPPELWFEWPGKNLVPYLEAGVVRDLEPIWAESDMGEYYPDEVLEIATPDGEYYPIPTNMHRVNNLFYNVELAEQAGVDPTRIDDPRELVEVLAQIDGEVGVPGMVQPMQNPWTVLQLWANVLLGLTDQSVYEGVTEGDTRRHSGAIEEALSVVDEMATLAQEDALFTSFTDANEQFVDGDSVFFHNGDWAAELYTPENDFVYERDWGHVPFPGTEGLYTVNLDAVMATEKGDLEDLRVFLEFAGSVEGQTVFNKPKGSIPPRTDADLSAFPPLMQEQYRDFQNSRGKPGTITHGLAVDPSELMDLSAAFASFVSDRDVKRATDDIVDALAG